MSQAVLNTGHKPIGITGMVSALLKRDERDNRQINEHDDNIMC